MGIAEKVLLHVGYHKTGTTWLQHHVFNNSEFGFVSPMSIKEMTEIIVLPNDLDFSPENCELAIARSLEHLDPRDSVPVFSNERFSGHPHSGGYDSRLLADRLKTLFPEARILIGIREQKKVILSCYNQYIKMGGASSIDSYLKMSDRRQVPLFDYRHFMYHRLVAYYQSIFGRDRVCALPYELFAQDSANFVSRIMEFATGQPCQVSPDTLPTQKLSNRSITGFELMMRRLINFTVGSRSPINQLSIMPMKKQRTDLLFKQIRKLHPIVPASLNRAIMARLEARVSGLVGSRYCESNRMTSDLIEVDLSQLGYQT